MPVVDGKAQNFSCDHCSGCMTTFATLGHMYVFGVDPVGPYHSGKHGGWPTRLPEVCCILSSSLLTLLPCWPTLHAEGLLGSARCTADGHRMQWVQEGLS